jgi:uncharacterized protein (TIGR02246 family)
MAALHPQVLGAERVREVFARVRKGDAAGAADLYAEDGKILFTGGEAKGRQTIAAFYQRIIETYHPQPQVEAVFADAPHYVAIVSVPNDHGVTRAADLFELCDDGIRQLEIFSRQ